MIFADPYGPLDNMNAMDLRAKCQVDWMKMPSTGNDTMRHLLR
jgi:hypothetical protein